MSSDAPSLGADGRFVKTRKEELRFFKITFFTKSKQLYAEYLIEAGYEHEAWALAHARLGADHQNEDPGQFIFDIEAL